MMDDAEMQQKHKKPAELQYMVASIPYYPHPYAVDLR